VFWKNPNKDKPLDTLTTFKPFTIKELEFDFYGEEEEEIERY